MDGKERREKFYILNFIFFHSICLSHSQFHCLLVNNEFCGLCQMLFCLQNIFFFPVRKTIVIQANYYGFYWE